MSRNCGVHEASETQPTIDEGQGLEVAAEPVGSCGAYWTSTPLAGGYNITILFNQA